MKNTALFIFISFLALSCARVPKEKPMDKVVSEALDNALKRATQMALLYANNDSVLPRSFVAGKMTTSDSRWWCSGFFPGMLWYLYEHTRDENILAYAKQYTSRVEREQFTTSSHDLGFILYCSYGNGYRITQDSSYKKILLTGAKSLSNRFNAKVGMIRSWDWNKQEWQFPVIIDNMMNLELLTWADKVVPADSFGKIAVSHADKTMEHHYRSDISCYHVVSFDTISGKPQIKQTHQGFSDETSWSRGQAWGLYGYTFMYRETQEVRYLDRAKQIASWLLSHPNMPTDFIPYWDFNAPSIPDEPRDASAAAIMASALIELSQFVDENLSKRFIDAAEKQLRVLASSEYTARIGENGHFILMHSVGSMPGRSEVDVPLTYADYYYVEALMRYKKMFQS